MKTRLFSVMAFVLVLAIALAACAPAATEAPPPPKPTEQPPAAQPTEAPPAESPAAPTEEIAPKPEIDCMEAKAGDTLTLMYQWSAGEEEKFNTIIKPFVDACGVKISAETTRDNAVLDTRVKSTPPDVLFWPTLAPLTLYTDKLVDLKSLGVDGSNYAEVWSKLGSANDKWLAVPVKADLKTIIWYSPAQFDAFGYQVPTTWEELDALVEKMVQDGNVPWSMGFESGAATGWTGSDFVQDILLATQGPDYVDEIISGKVAYDDAAVQDAYKTFTKWASDAKYTVGGATGTVNTGFLDAIYKVFQEKPEALMVKQSGFAGGEIVKQFPDLKYGVDFDFFLFPGAKGVQGGADYMMAFKDAPAVRALVAYLTGEVGVRNWVQAGFDLSPNKLAVGKYPDEQMAKRGEMLAQAAGFTPDMGDTIGEPFSSAEWKALINVVQGKDIKTELATVAAAQKQALSK